MTWPSRMMVLSQKNGDMMVFTNDTVQPLYLVWGHDSTPGKRTLPNKVNFMVITKKFKFRDSDGDI